ncbi:MAG: hypothetical protein WCQ50_16345 [Spirochaetota bacterium]
MFYFSDFEVENRVRYSVLTLTEQPKWCLSYPAAGFEALGVPCFAGSERVTLSLALPVFNPLKTPEITEPLPRKPLRAIGGFVPRVA